MPTCAWVPRALQLAAAGPLGCCALCVLSLHASLLGIGSSSAGAFLLVLGSLYLLASLGSLPSGLSSCFWVIVSIFSELPARWAGRPTPLLRLRPSCSCCGGFHPEDLPCAHERSL